MYLKTAQEQMLQDLRHKRLSHTTLTLYRQALDGFIDWLELQSIFEAREVHRHHIEVHQQKLLQTYKPRTVAQRVQALRKLFRFLTAQGYLLLDPSEDVIALKAAKREVRRRVSEQEMKKLLAAPNVSLRHGVRDRALLEVLYSTAARIGEVMNLEVSDVDLQLRLLRLRAAKGGRERVVPLGFAAHRWLKEYLESVRPWWTKNQGHQRKLWVTHSGRPFEANNAHTMLHIQSKRARIKPIYPHAIRHAAATHMLAQGADIRAIQKLLGHKSIATTQKYTKVQAMELHKTHQSTHPLEAAKVGQ